MIEGGGFNLAVVSEQTLYTALWPTRSSGETLVGICGICVLSKSNSGVRCVHLVRVSKQMTKKEVLRNKMPM